MTVEPLEFAEARNCMVDSQIRPNRVTDPAILRAMRILPRERFLPGPLRARAYVDDDVPLGGGRFLIEPLVTARLIQLVAPSPGERGLVVAAGLGYGAAVLAACGVTVVALEEDPALAAQARATLPSLAPAVRLVEGKFAAGWGDAAPWDMIVIEGAVTEIPAAFAKQLNPSRGRLSAVLTGHGASPKAVLAELTPSGLHAEPMFDCATPLIPSLLPRPGFVF